jgi:hypothetical protein
LDYELGLDGWNISKPAEFWTRVQSHLRTLPLEHPRPITRLLLAGDSAKNEMFLKVLRDALAEVSSIQRAHTVQLDSSVRVTSSNLVNPVFAAARGAAIYARRRQEAPADCVELKACEEKRNRERGKFGPKLELK